MNTINNSRVDGIDIGPRQKITATKYIEENTSNLGGIVATAGLLAGIGASNAGSPQLATTLFLAAGVTAIGLSTISVATKAVPLAISAKNFIAHQKTTIASSKNIMDYASDALQTLKVSAKAYMARTSAVHVGLVIASAIVAAVTARYMYDLQALLPTNDPLSLGGSCKLLLNGLYGAIHPPITPYGNATSDVIELNELTHIEHTGDILKTCRTEYINDLAAILAQDTPSRRQAELSKIELKWELSIKEQMPMYNEHYLNTLRQASVDGIKPDLPHVTSGAMAHYFGYVRQFNTAIEQFKTSASISRKPSAVFCP